MGFSWPLLGVMELESNSFEWKDIGALTVKWLQDAGGFAAVGLLLWFVYVMATPAPAVAASRRQLISRFMAVCGIGALIVYLVALGIIIYIASNTAQVTVKPPPIRPGEIILPEPETPLEQALDAVLAIAGTLALAGFCEPFFRDVVCLRGRRVYALAKLSFVEAVRRRVVWVFFLFLLVILFPAGWFWHQHVKPEDMLKSSIEVLTYAMTFLTVLTALLLSSFSIPTDVKNQTIHTIVTKPVERFEIVAGRFLGYVSLLTLALLFMTSVSLLIILTSDVPEVARSETMKARVPDYGSLHLLKERVESQQLQSQPFTGVDVGRELGYRKYIAGRSSQRAIWDFGDRSDLIDLSKQPIVTLEYAFDVYRTTKGEENRGVSCDFDLVTWKWDRTRQDEYANEIRRRCGGSYPANARPENEEQWRAANEIAEKYGRYELGGIQVYDYRTYARAIPAGLLKNALEGTPPKDSANPQGGKPVLLHIKVKCNSPSQFIGVAPLDLYLLEKNESFTLNFFKQAIGLWCRLCIVTALAVAASTYFSGVISLLLAGGLFIAGYFQTFIKSIAVGNNDGGGPMESLTKLIKGIPVAGPLDKTPGVQVLLGLDVVFRWVLRRVFNVMPDIERFAWDNYLAEGFSIRADFILLNVLFMAAYVLPWAVLAYYLMRSREIAA